jgi:hypothetical protein
VTMTDCTRSRERAAKAKKRSMESMQVRYI